MTTELDYVRDNIEAAVAVKQQMLNDPALLERILGVAEICVDALKKGNKIIFAGNGGSAGDSQHLAAELVGRYKFDRPGLPALALTTDSSALTAIGNDYGYDRVFERQIEAMGVAGDVFFGITTSGNSKNVLLAIKEAAAKGIITVGLAGNGGAIQDMCDYCISVPTDETPRIQECHIMIGQIICGFIERTMFPQD